MKLFSLKNEIKKESDNANIKERNNFMMIRAFNFSLISSFNNKIKIIKGINSLNKIINSNLLKNKICFYVNILSHCYDIKDNDNYINIRKLLSNILLKKIINKKYTTLKYYFYKYHFKLCSFNNKSESNTNNLQEIIEKYEKIISKISKEHTQELMKLSNENLSLPSLLFQTQSPIFT